MKIRFVNRNSKFYSVCKTGLLQLFTLVCVAAFTHAVQAQTTESLAVKELAPESTPLMQQLARADDFKEPATAEKIESEPYEKFVSTNQQSDTPVYHQPHGTLSNKIAFAMAGHGWTYDSDEMYYYTQRGLSHGMVEDLGNADQMHIFAHMLFNSGATVVPLRPIDHQPNERVLDNTMPQVQFFGDWRAGASDRYYGEAGDEIPYAVSNASLLESAVARYQPYIPEDGYYPVYVWARDGADRSNQLYRVNHSGGTAEVRVNWKKIGKAWVWLGTYYFEKGMDGYVDISNQVIDPYEAYNNHVVVADAVRFGNGQGDVQRPGGISGFLREDEGDCYWIERSLGENANRYLFDIGRDGSSTVSSPPKAAAHINRELVGSYLDRILISFHSNASSGKARGAVALFNASANKRPSYQEDLAEHIGVQVNTQMLAEESPSEQKWTERERHTYSGINFGELRRDYVQNEMCATIVETAFHDNREDVDFLLDPEARIQMAEATLRGIFHWYADIVNSNAAEEMPPSRPPAIAATIKDGEIQVKWKLGAVGKYDGSPAVRVRIARSANGYGFDGGELEDAEVGSATIDPLTTSGVTFIRITALNGAGESFPSQTIAVGLGKGSKSADNPKSLHIAVNTILDRSTDVPYDLGIQVGGPYKDSAETVRVRAVYAMTEPSGVAEALALNDLNQAFDGADSAAYEAGLVDRNAYKRVFLTTEQQNPRKPIFSEALENQLRSLLSRNGKLYISGSGYVANLTNYGSKHKTFLNNILGITGEETAKMKATIQSMDDRFFPTSGSLNLQANNRFWGQGHEVQPASLKLRKGRSLGLIKYVRGINETGIAAALTRPSYSEGEIISLGFPMSLIKDRDARKHLMQAILKQL